MPEQSFKLVKFSFFMVGFEMEASSKNSHSLILPSMTGAV